MSIRRRRYGMKNNFQCGGRSGLASRAVSLASALSPTSAAIPTSTGQRRYNVTITLRPQREDERLRSVSRHWRHIAKLL